jgi:hypothetical protein
MCLLYEDIKIKKFSDIQEITIKSTTTTPTQTNNLLLIIGGITAASLLIGITVVTFKSK